MAAAILPTSLTPVPSTLPPGRRRGRERAKSSGQERIRLTFFYILSDLEFKAFLFRSFKNRSPFVSPQYTGVPLSVLPIPRSTQSSVLRKYG